MNKKEALLEAAKDLFGRYGYAETTFKKISEQAGVALGLLTHHYGSKEKLFLAAGLDVLERFEKFLTEAVTDAKTGYQAVMNFCEAYLAFSLDKESSWLVLVRCSPYSDMKTGCDRDLMDSRFSTIHDILAAQIKRGMEDKTINCSDAQLMSQVIISLMVGVNRTKVLTPYAQDGLYPAALKFVSNAISNSLTSH